jgi:excisionase family DNA binding protein
MAMAKEPEVGPDLLTSQQVAERVGICVRTLWRLLAQGKFPQPVRASNRLVRWRMADVQEYIESLS